MVLDTLTENITGYAGHSLEVLSFYLHTREFTFFLQRLEKVFFFLLMSIFSFGVGISVAQYRPLWVVLDMVRGSVTEEREDTSQ